MTLDEACFLCGGHWEVILWEGMGWSGMETTVLLSQVSFRATVMQIPRRAEESRPVGGRGSGASSNTGGLLGNPLPLQRNANPVCGTSCSQDPPSINAGSGSVCFSLLRGHCCPGLFNGCPVFQDVDLLQHVHNVRARNERCLLPLAGWHRVPSLRAAPAM